MPTSVPGSDTSSQLARSRREGGFTLLELILVVTIIALASAVATLSLRDPAATRLEREGQRLALLLEAGRAQSRALGIPIRWESGAARPVFAGQPAARGEDTDADFRFVGAPDLGREAALPTRFLEAADDGARIAIDLGARPQGIVLGPEPFIGEQRITLRLGEHRLQITTDGLGPFAVTTP